MTVLLNGETAGVELSGGTANVTMELGGSYVITVEVVEPGKVPRFYMVYFMYVS